MEYDRGDSFAFDFEPIGASIWFEMKRKTYELEEKQPFYADFRDRKRCRFL